jgi:hypothetical protein
VSTLVRARAVLSYRDVRSLCELVLVAQVLDLVTTWIALDTGRFAEGNQLLGPLVDHHPAVAYSVKLAAACMVVAGAVLLRIRWRMRVVVLRVLAIASVAAPLVNSLRLAGWV